MITIQGKGVSAGVGVGPLYFYRRATAEIKRYTVEDTDAEWHRFKGAQTGAIEQLGVLAEQARKEAGDEAAMLFETHQMMAEDLDYEEAIEDRIVNQKMNAEAAVSDTSEQFAEMFASMDDAYMQARAADVKDVSQRILGILCGIVQGGIASDVPVLLCADDLAPSETIQLDKSKVLGFITAGGSGSSHTAILARTLGIPAIVGMGDALKPELEGRAAIADGSTGALVIDPDDDTRDRLLKKRDEQLRLQRLLETLFPGGVDTLANHPHTIQSDGCHRGTDKTGVVIVPGYGLFSFQNCRQPTNVFRGCTATAAHDGDTSLHAGQQSLGKVLRSHIIVSIHRVRQARVRLGNDRQAGILTQFFQQRRQQVWPQRTVQSNSVRTQALQCTGHGGDRTAGEGPAAGIKGHGDKHRQVGGLLGRQQGSLGLVQVCHGFHHD